MSNQSNLPDHVAEDSPPAIKNANLSNGGAISALIPKSLDDTFRLAKALAASGEMVPQHFQKNPEAVMAAIVRGMEIGLAPMQALSNIAVINGRACIWGDAIPATLQRAGHHIDVEIEGEGDDAVATATLTRGDTGKTISRSFSMADARKANLLGKKGPWQQYPRRMLAHRARGWAARDGAADALMGLQIAEEVSDYAPTRDITPKAGGFAAKAQAARPSQQTTEEPKHEVQEEAPAPVEEMPVEDAEILPPEDDQPPAEHDANSLEFAEGKTGAENGKALNECPYDMGAEKWVNWAAGWNFAKEGEGNG